jgi:hypothetical protein
MPGDPTWFIDSFDAWPSTDHGGKWMGGSAYSQENYSRTGPNSVLIGPGGNLSNPASGLQVSVGFAANPRWGTNIAGYYFPFSVRYTATINRISSVTGEIIGTFVNEGTNHFGLRQDENTFYAQFDYISTILGPGETIYDFNPTQAYWEVWNHYNFTVKIVGVTETGYTMEMQMWLNGENLGSVSREYGLSAILITEGWVLSNISFSSYSIGRAYYGNVFMYVDDFYYTNDGSLFGDKQIMVLKPESDIYNQWTPSSGSDNFNMVNDPYNDGDATYNYSSTLNSRDFFEVEDSGLPNDTIVYGAQAIISLKKNPQDSDGAVTLDASASSIVEGALKEMYAPSDYSTYTAQIASIAGGVIDSVVKLDSVRVGYTKSQ